MAEAVQTPAAVTPPTPMAVTSPTDQSQKEKALAAVAKAVAAESKPTKGVKPAATQSEAPKPGETAPDPAKAAASPADKLKSEVLAEAARAEAKIKREREALKKDQDQLAAGKKQVEEAERLRTLAKSDPYAAFKELGLPYDKITERILSEPDGPPDPNAARFKALEDQLAEERRLREEDLKQRQSQSMSAQVANVKAAIKTGLDSSESYVLLRQTIPDAHEAIWDTIVKTHALNGTALTWEQAAQALEDQLVAWKEKFTAAPEQDPDAEPEETPPVQSSTRKPTPKKTAVPSSSPKTLSNRLTPGQGGAANPPLPTDWEARKAEIARRAASLK